jgi:hypothetical protein
MTAAENLTIILRGRSVSPSGIFQFLVDGGDFWDLAGVVSPTINGDPTGKSQLKVTMVRST